MATKVNNGISLTLRELVEQKEKEWKEAQDLRIKSLEVTLAEKEKLINNEQVRFRKLREDFEYNLKLLEERDVELERYDSLFSQLKNIESARNAEVSDLKINLDDLKVKLEQEVKAQEDLKRHYQQRIREHQQELNQFRLAKEADIKKERAEYESFKRDFQRRLRAAEEDIETQRQELMSGFDGALQKREHEFRLKLDEMSNSLLASDLKVKMLTKELELVRAGNEQTKDDLQSTTTNVQELEKALKQMEWQLTDERNMGSAKVQELESKIEQIILSKKRAQENFQLKHAELDRYVREKEAALVASKQAHHERELKLEEKIKELQSKQETREVEFRRLDWAHRDSVKEKDLQVQRLQATVSDLQSKLESQSSEQSRLTVAKDLELEALRQQEEKMRVEIAQRKEDLDKYKRELTMALEREASLEQAKTQLEVDWQRRCEDTERDVVGKQEELVTNLAKARDEALALARHRQQALTQQEHFIRVLTQSRDEAITTLQRHGLSIPTELPSRDLNHEQGYESRDDKPKLSANQSVALSEKIRILEEQNAGLRGVVRQMRQEMEDLTNQQANTTPVVIDRGNDEKQGAPAPLTAEYVKSLESEIRGLRSKNRSLTQRVEELAEAVKPPVTANVLKGKMADPFIQTHIKELNDTIGALRQDKLDLQAQTRKHQATATHVQGLLSQCQEEVRQKQLAIDQLKYELSTEGRRSIEQLNANKQKIANLELQFAQVRHEADEYYKTGLERNLEATALGNQVSSLKLHLASSGQTGSTHFSPQAAIIQKLQDEVERLRNNSLQEKAADNSAGPSLLLNTAGDSGVVLRAKLKSAAQRISQLAREKEQLIQIGNRLRAELARISGTRPERPKKDDGVEHPAAAENLINEVQRGASAVAHPRSLTPAEIADQVQGQLSAVEKLQYQLTTHELKYAKQQVQHEQNAADKARVTVVASSSSSEASTSLDRRETAGVLPPDPGESPAEHIPAKHPVPQPSKLNPAITSQKTTPGGYEQALFTSSSEGHSSLQEIWKILDEEESFLSSNPGSLPLRVLPARPTSTQVSTESASDFALKGRQTATELKPRSKRPELSRKAAGKAKFVSQKPRVRNYNIRNDSKD